MRFKPNPFRVQNTVAGGDFGCFVGYGAWATSPRRAREQPQGKWPCADGNSSYSFQCRKQSEGTSDGRHDKAWHYLVPENDDSQGAFGSTAIRPERRRLILQMVDDELEDLRWERATSWSLLKLQAAQRSLPRFFQESLRARTVSFPSSNSDSLRFSWCSTPSCFYAYYVHDSKLENREALCNA